MITLESVKKMYSKERLIVTPDKVAKRYERPPPKDSTLDIVIAAVKKYDGITRQELHKLTKLSFSCLNRSFQYLLDEKRLGRVAVKNAGAYKIYSYSVKGLS